MSPPNLESPVQKPGFRFLWTGLRKPVVLKLICTGLLVRDYLTVHWGVAGIDSMDVP